MVDRVEDADGLVRVVCPIAQVTVNMSMNAVASLVNILVPPLKAHAMQIMVVLYYYR